MINNDLGPTWRRWLLVRRSLDDPEDLAYYIAAGPRRTTLTRLAKTAGARWSIEHHFQRLTDLLHCEVPTLGYPRAALFAFCISVVAILLGNLRVVHGEGLMAELSEHGRRCGRSRRSTPG